MSSRISAVNKEYWIKQDTEYKFSPAGHPLLYVFCMNTVAIHSHHYGDMIVTSLMQRKQQPRNGLK